MSEAKIPPGPRGHFLMGVLPEVRKDVLGFFRKSLQEYGDVSRYRLGPMTSHLIVHPDGVKRVLLDNVKNYSKAHLTYALARRVVGNGLVTSDGAFWLRQRRLAQPAFHRERIAAMTQGMITAAQQTVDEWEGHAQAGTAVSMVPEMMRLTLKIVVDALFGSSVDERADKVGEAFYVILEDLVTRFRELQILPPVLPTRRDRRFRAAVRTLDEIVLGLIRERRARGDAHERPDLLSLFMSSTDADTGEKMDDRQLRDEVLTMVFAGHETTATALSWTFILLDRHPDVAARLGDELHRELGEQPLTPAHLPRLTYARMIIDETLRLYPPIYILGRKVVADDVLCGYLIKAGSSVDICPWITHRHPEFWEDPDRFNPDRFTADAVAARPRFAYLPFLGGPRQCIGNMFALTEAQIILATIVRRFRPRIVDDQEARPDPLVTLRPRGDVRMTLQRVLPRAA